MKKLNAEMIKDFDTKLNEISENCDCGYSEDKLKQIATKTFYEMFPDVSVADRNIALRICTDLWD